MEEVHLFIIWENALYKKEEIIKDIRENFEILSTYQIEWSLDNFSENLSRFYGTNLPAGCGKEKHCGNGPFLLIIVKDKNPKYEKRQTSRGEEIVNAKMFDKKTYYREITGGGHKIHATNSVEETNHDITLLLGKNIEDFLKENTKKEETIKIKQDLFGAKEWENVNKMFYALNNCCKYAILRNYETLPEEIYINEHNDIDIICTSHIDVAYVLNAKKVFLEDYRVHYVTKVEGKEAFFDLRYVGDGYYCEELEKSLIENRKYNEKGFYTISDDEYYYTLLYHALLHKKEFAKDYKERLKQMKSKININKDVEFLKVLQKWLIDNEYFVTIPNDISVQFNKEKSRSLSKLVYRNEEEIKELEVQNKQIQEENESLKNENKKIQDELISMVNSKSWKITKPIRDFRTKKIKR